MCQNNLQMCCPFVFPVQSFLYNGIKLLIADWGHITVLRPMNCVARKMWGIHDAVRAHKARRHFRFSLTSIPNIPKRDLYGCPSRRWKNNRSNNCYCGNVRKMLSLSINAGCGRNENCSTRNVQKIFRLLQRKLRATAAWEYMYT